MKRKEWISMGDFCGPDRHEDKSMMNAHVIAEMKDVDYNHPKSWPKTGIVGPSAEWEQKLQELHEQDIHSDPIVGTPLVDELVEKVKREVAETGSPHSESDGNALPAIYEPGCWTIEPMVAVNGTPLGAIEGSPYWRKGELSKQFEAAAEHIGWEETPNGRKFHMFSIKVDGGHWPVVIWRKKVPHHPTVKDMEAFGFRFTTRYNKWFIADESMGCAIRLASQADDSIEFLMFGEPGCEYFPEQCK